MTPSETMLAYVGTYTRNNESKGIYICELDMASGDLAVIGHGPWVESPSFLAIHPSKRYLYACNSLNEWGGKPGGAVSAFAIDPGTGALELLNQESTLGAGPCHVSVDASGKAAMATNYSGGSLCLFPLLDDGRLAPASDFHQLHGAGVDPRRQTQAHAHSIWPDPTNRYALACDLGTDRVMIYALDLEGGKLVPNRMPFARIRPGAGPRHLDFHPNGRWVYVVNEMISSVTLFDWYAERGVLSEVAHVPAAPASAPESNTGADIHVTPDGRFCYSTNRDHNSLAMFALDQETGVPSLIGYESTRGDHPRNFAIDPTGHWLLCANQNTDNIVTYRIDPETGHLKITGFELKLPRPVCIKFMG
jgi:6-phosphogluconolactonase